jgi:hypothetical protein
MFAKVNAKMEYYRKPCGGLQRLWPNPRTDADASAYISSKNSGMERFLG